MPRIAGQQVIGLVLVALLGLGLPHRTSAVPVVSAVAELATGSTWVLHYDPQIDAALLETHGSLLDQLPPGTRVVIGLSGDVSSRRYRELLGAERLARHEMIFLPVSGDVSPWARDRYLACTVDGHPRMILPDETSVDEGRLGDLAVGRRVARLEPETQVVPSALAIEGGNVIVDDQSILVGISILRDNAERGFSTHEVTHDLRELFQRQPILLGDRDNLPPNDHIDMFVALAGPGRALVADPRLAAPYFEALRELGLSSGQIGEVGAVALKDDLVFSDAYDSIALQLEQAGYEVARIPILHTVDRLLLTWTNAIVERSGAARRVWLPAYGVPILDRMAQQIWQDEGFEVLTIPCQHIIPWGGALRCLTNVIEPTRDLKR